MARIKKNVPPLFDYSGVNDYTKWGSKKIRNIYNPYGGNQWNTMAQYADYYNNPNLYALEQQGLINQQQRQFDLMYQNEYADELDRYIRQGNMSGTMPKSSRRKDELAFTSNYYKPPTSPSQKITYKTPLTAKRKKSR